MHGPGSHGCDTTSAGDELEDGDREFGSAPLRRNACGAENLAKDVEAFAVDRIGDEGFALEILRGQVGFAEERMGVGKESADLVSEEGMVGDPCSGFGVGDEGEVGLVGSDEIDRVFVEAADKIHFHFRPVLAEGVHGGHEPVEARVAFHGDAELPRLPVAQSEEVSVVAVELAEDVVGRFEQTEAQRSEADRLGLSFEDKPAGVLLDVGHLPGDGGLGEVKLASGSGEVAGVGELDEEAEVSNFEHRLTNRRAGRPANMRLAHDDAKNKRFLECSEMR